MYVLSACRKPQKPDIHILSLKRREKARDECQAKEREALKRDGCVVDYNEVIRVFLEGVRRRESEQWLGMNKVIRWQGKTDFPHRHTQKMQEEETARETISNVSQRTLVRKGTAGWRTTRALLPFAARNITQKEAENHTVATKIRRRLTWNRVREARKNVEGKRGSGSRNRVRRACWWLGEQRDACELQTDTTVQRSIRMFWKQH